MPCEVFEAHLFSVLTNVWGAVCPFSFRWVLFPPGTPRSIVKPEPWLQAIGEGEAVDWFMKHFEVKCTQDTQIYDENLCKCERNALGVCVSMSVIMN